MNVLPGRPTELPDSVWVAEVLSTEAALRTALGFAPGKEPPMHIGLFAEDDGPKL